MAVRHPYVIRPEQVGLAALEGFQRLEFVRTHAALLAGLRAQLGEEAAHRVDAWAAGILRPEVLIGRFDTGLLRLLVVLEEYRRPHRHAHVRLAPSRCEGDLAMLAVVGQPALEGALAEGAVCGLAVVGTLDALDQVGAELAVTG
ncbi:hypothetical protein D3C78_1442610 [compost metagenome]